MKILLTGACGVLGSAVSALALERGHEIVGVDLPEAVARAGPGPFPLFPLSYEETEALRPHLEGCGGLVHTAGPHGRMVGTVDLAGFLQANVVSVGRLLEAAAGAGIGSVVLSSTMEIVVGRDWTASGMAVVDEQAPPRCDSAYGTSRLLQERLAQDLAERLGLSIAVLRYMAFERLPDEALGLRLLARYVGARDAASAVLAALQPPRPLRGEVFHIGAETPLTNGDIAAAQRGPEAVLERLFPGSVELLRRNGVPVAPWHFWPVTRIDKARSLLGWRPEASFETWLRGQGWKRE